MTFRCRQQRIAWESVQEAEGKGSAVRTTPVIGRPLRKVDILHWWSTKLAMSIDSLEGVTDKYEGEAKTVYAGLGRYCI